MTDCPYTGIESHECHLGPCDCFDDIGCARCAALPPWPTALAETGEQLIERLLAPCIACGHYRDTPNHEHGCAAAPKGPYREIEEDA